MVAAAKTHRDKLFRVHIEEGVECSVRCLDEISVAKWIIVL